MTASRTERPPRSLDDAPSAGLRRRAPARAPSAGRAAIFSTAASLTLTCALLTPPLAALSAAFSPSAAQGDAAAVELAQSPGEPGGSVGAPIRLSPPAPNGEAAGGQAGEGGQASGASGDAPSALSPPGSGRQGIEVDRLDSPRIESIGLLDSGNGGLGSDLWAGSRRATLLGLMAQLPAAAASPALNGLTRRLLLTNAAAPDGALPPGESQTPGLLEARARALFDLGALEDVNGLLSIAPQRLLTADLAQLRVESLFLTDAMAEACQLVEGWVTATPDLVFWQKALAVCQLEEGEAERAALTASLLRESGFEEDARFLALVAEAAETPGGASQVAAAPSAGSASDAAQADSTQGEDKLNAVDLGLLRHAPGEASGLALDDTAAPPSLGVLRGLSNLEGLEARARAKALERLVAAGLPLDEALREAYRALEFTPDDLDAAAARDEMPPADDGLGERALMLQAAERAEQPAVRAEVLRVALQRAAESGDYLLMTKALRPLLTALPMTQDLVWFSGAAVRALYALDQRERAAEWLTLARQEAILNPEAAASLTALWPYARLYNVEAIVPNAGLGVWRQTQTAAQPRDLADGQIVVQSMLQALGKVEPVGWSEFVLLRPGDARPQPPLPPAPLLFALEEASQAGRRGESVLLSVLALGGRPLAEAHPLALSRVLAALNRVGLRDEARGVAVEALLQGGV